MSDSDSDFWKSYSDEFKRKLITTIKEHPNLWDKNTQKYKEWIAVKKEMDCVYTIKVLQAIWVSLMHRYFRKIFIRTIERNFEAPRWPLFHDMSFLYEHTKEKIQKKLGGISPPLFKQNSLPRGIVRPQCPCCIYVGSNLNSENADSSSLECKQVSDEFENMKTYETENFEGDETENFEGDETENFEGDNNDSEMVHSVNSVNSVVEENDKQCNDSQTNSAPSPQNEVSDTLDEQPVQDETNETNADVYELIDEAENRINPPLDQVLTNDINPLVTEISHEPVNSLQNAPIHQDKVPDNTIGLIVVTGIPQEPVNSLEKAPTQDKPPDEIIDLMDDDDDDVATNNQSTSSQPQPAIPANTTTNTPVFYSMQQLFLMHNLLEPLKINSFRSINSALNGRSSAELPQSPQPPMETLTNVTNVTNGFSIVSENSNGSQNSNGNQAAVEPVFTVNTLRAIERKQLIDAVRANPVVYVPSMMKKRMDFIAAWNQISKEVNNVPAHTLKNRWKSLKTRYLKELVHERYSGGTKSSWECFDQLEFLRPHMQVDIDEIHSTRKQIQDTIRQNAASVTFGTSKPTSQVNSTPEPQTSAIETVTKHITLTDKITSETSDKNFLEGRTITQFGESDTCAVAFVNSQQTLQIASVESMKVGINVSKEPEKVQQAIVVDPATLPILQNRPIKITAVQAIPSLDLTNEDDENDVRQSSNGEASTPALDVAPPPAKKLRKSSGFVVNRANVLVNEIPTRLTPSPAPPQRLPSPAVPQPPKRLSSPATQPPPKRLPSPEVPISILVPSAPAPRLTLDLTADEAPTVPAPIAIKQKPQKVFPPLDLTLDDDDENPTPKPTKPKPTPTPTPPAKPSSTSEFQKAFVNAFLNGKNSVEYPNLDLTKNEDKEKHKKSNGCKRKNVNGKTKDDDNVICLDDDEDDDKNDDNNSVSSYEEVIVYFEEEQKK